VLVGHRRARGDPHTGDHVRGVDIQTSAAWMQHFHQPLPSGAAPLYVRSGSWLEALQRRGRDVGGRFEGFKFSATSKQQLMEGLAVAIQQQQIHVPAGVLVDELETFEYAYTRTGVHYSAPSGCHDDAVCALALARAAASRSASRPSLAAGALYPLYY
jgi:hypothetical protein